jgi:hypothetical protein
MYGEGGRTVSTTELRIPKTDLYKASKSRARDHAADLRWKKYSAFGASVRLLRAEEPSKRTIESPQ